MVFIVNQINPLLCLLLECATLLRYFGVRAVVVDIHPEKISSTEAENSSTVELFDFLWRYFSNSRVFPLYLQHDGHSRTVVGIQKTLNEEKVDGVILFDPALDGSFIRSSLIQRNNTWKRQLVKGFKAMNHSRYQVVYILPGLMSLQERERSKVLVGENPAKSIDMTFNEL